MKMANKIGFKYGETPYFIGNEYGLLCVSYGYDEHEALDHAADEGFLNSQLMSHEDHEEYQAQGWHDSFVYLGNGGEPYWSEYLWIKNANEREKTAPYTLKRKYRGGA